jgi:hypothetical protein
MNTASNNAPQNAPPKKCVNESIRQCTTPSTEKMHQEMFLAITEDPGNGSIFQNII